MKNYYDELEVSKTASKEVIEKVYKVLAKKYHPDTTKEINKQTAEEKFKIISEAYEILSDDEKRKKYNLELEQSNPTISYNEFNQFRNSDNKNYYSQNQYNQMNSHFNIDTINYQNERQTSTTSNTSLKNKIKDSLLNIFLLLFSIITTFLIMKYLFNFDLLSLFL